MPSWWPPFLHRVRATRRARRAIGAGEYGAALDLLREPAVARSTTARALRDLAIERLCRCAGLAIATGDVAGAKHALALVARDDPTRGIAWGRRLALAGADKEPAEVERPLVRLLGQMRAEQSASDSKRAHRVSSPHNGTSVTADPAGRASMRFHVEVDDGGEFLAVAGARIVIGHLRSSAADLRFLADIDADHVRLVRRDSFHAGPSWQLERGLAPKIRVNGRVLEDPSTGLFDGDEVELARNLSFRFREPQPSSQSAVLELLRGAECEGALKILLLAPGEAGVVRIGSKRDRHIPLADIEHEVSLKLSGSDLWIHCAGGVRAVESGDSSDTLVVACPPQSPQHLSVRARAHGRAPVGISLRQASNA